VTALKNSTAFYVTRNRVAHEPDFAATAACGVEFRPGEIRRMTYAELLVWVKPAYCKACFPGGEPR
jgi:hypothetical protein